MTSLSHRTATLLLCVFLAACASKLTQESFEKIGPGMSQAQVREILGEPSEANEGSFLGLSGGNATWRDGKTIITVQFVNGKVMSKQMSPAKKNERD